MIQLSERCRLTLESLARLHRDDPEASYKPDLLDALACGKLAAHGLCDRVSDKPRRYRIAPAGVAWLGARQFTEALAAAPVAPRQIDLFGASPRRLVVHCKRDPHDVYIGRPGPWGNPFKLKSEAERTPELLARYEAWLRAQPELVARARRELRGKVLGCWCAPKLCHGDVLARVANEEAP